MTEEEKQIRLGQAYRSVFKSQDGELILEDLRRLSNFDLSMIPRDSTGRIDTNEVMRNEGQRAVVVHIIRKTQVKPKEEKQTEAINERIE